MLARSLWFSPGFPSSIICSIIFFISSALGAAALVATGGAASTMAGLTASAAGLIASAGLGIAAEVWAKEMEAPKSAVSNAIADLTIRFFMKRIVRQSVTVVKPVKGCRAGLQRGRQRGGNQCNQTSWQETQNENGPGQQDQ